MEDEKTGRRSFVNWFLGTSLGALCLSVVYPVIRFVSPPEIPEATTNQVEAGLTTDPELMEKKFKIVRFGADPVLLVWAGEDESVPPEGKRAPDKGQDAAAGPRVMRGQWPQ